jgi:hypothetical protein
MLLNNLTKTDNDNHGSFRTTEFLPFMKEKILNNYPIFLNEPSAPKKNLKINQNL